MKYSLLIILLILCFGNVKAQTQIDLLGNSSFTIQNDSPYNYSVQYDGEDSSIRIIDSVGNEAAYQLKDSPLVVVDTIQSIKILLDCFRIVREQTDRDYKSRQTVDSIQYAFEDRLMQMSDAGVQVLQYLNLDGTIYHGYSKQFIKAINDYYNLYHKLYP